MTIVAESIFIETKPVGSKAQPDFLNGAVLIETEMEEDELRGWLHKIENELGRIRGHDKFGPRSIDLDIVVWNETVVDQDIYERQFLYDSVVEVWPDFRGRLEASEI
ncbi:MAG: 2-amino-4-hydroxy-6-hydroxymethyldihydropteridine diphosphokinase [bacterium]